MEYISEKLYEQLLTIKNMSRLGVLTHDFNPRNQKAETDIPASEVNDSLVYANKFRTARSNY